jgi:hypothetical protein
MHWTFCAENGKVSFIYEAIGQHGIFTRNTLRIVPGRSVESVHLTTVNDQDFEEFEKTIAATEVENETVEWDCQDILNNLEDECIVDRDDKTYQKQKQKVKKKRGAM